MKICIGWLKFVKSLHSRQRAACDLVLEFIISEFYRESELFRYKPKEDLELGL